MASVEKLITDNIDIWSSAVKAKSAAGRGTSKKLDLYGIKKLRELILELAVRGLLVPQNPNDEPASMLLKKIASEKDKLVEEGKIKKQKKCPSIDKDVKPFTLPERWVWVSLNELCVLENGDRSKNYPNKSLLVEAGIPFVNAGHLQNGRINKEDMTFITDDRYSLLKAGKFSDGDILFCLRGSLGKSAIVEGFERGAIASSLVIVRLFSQLDRYYIHNFFDSPFSYGMIKLYDNGTAQPNLSAADLGKFLVPLPPESEQHRIVDKVDELMALCDQLEQQTEASISAHQTLVKTLLGTLTNTSERDGFNQAWARIAEHFDTLFTTEWSIDQLKQTILQLAVMGKLVPQNPNDEPASEVLHRAQTTKGEMAVSREIRKDKETYEIRKLFNISLGWEWSCIGLFSYVLGGKRVPRGYSLLDTPTEHAYIRVTDMKDNTVRQDCLKYIDDNIYEQISKYVINKEDVYVTIAGTIGAIGTIPDSLDGMNLTENASKLVFREINQNFLVVALSAHYIQEQFEEAVNKMAQPKLSLASIKHTSIAIPPLKEQRRIVAKVDELMTICDTLKTRINTVQITQLHLADAMAEQAIN